MVLGFSDSEWGAAARDFIPESHRALPMLRLFLPFRDPSREEGRDVVRWSRYVAVEEQSASLDWFDAADRIAEDEPGVRELVSCMGHLDDMTAAALRDVIGDASMRCLRWVGYTGETPHTDSPRRVFGEDYFESELRPDDVEPGRRVPQFAWDADGRLAWGGRLYPDSLIIAADVPAFRRLRQDTRIDTTSVRPERDILPRSAGD